MIGAYTHFVRQLITICRYAHGVVSLCGYVNDVVGTQCEANRTPCSGDVCVWLWSHETGTTRPI